MFIDETEDDDDLFETLEVSTTAPSARGNELLDALGEEEESNEEEEGVVLGTLEMGETMDGEAVDEETFFPQEEFSEEEEDVDPFEELGASPMDVSNNDDPMVSDALAAFMDDDDEEETKPQEVSLFEDTEEVEDVEETQEEVDDKPKADPEELYRFLLEGVWVDDVLDPAEVALMSRKRRELNISFETHLKILKEILHE